MTIDTIVAGRPSASEKRIGRGGKRGKTSGRGHKGQKARKGNSTRPEMRDIIKKLPKLRGHGVNRARTVYAERPRPKAINLATLEAKFEAGETISPKTLVAKKLVVARGGKNPQVKILGNGDLTKKLSFEGCAVSASAKAKIEKVGGDIK